MGQPRAKVLVLVDASRGAPGLHTCHGRAVILLDDDRQAIWQNPFLRRARRKSDDGRLLSCSGIPIGSAKHNRDHERHARRESHHTDFCADTSVDDFTVAGFAGANGFTKASSKS